jgi:hypothetical protein
MALPRRMDARKAPGAPGSHPADLVVFSIRGEATCDECHDVIPPGGLLRKENERALCLDCADLGHLLYLAAGNAALTRRAAKHSRLRAVVVRWSSARRRYERQGTLVDEAALARAETECLADAEVRETRRQREAVRREAVDREYVAAVARWIRERYPGCPVDEEERIAEHACRKHSGRVGRSEAARRVDAAALELAVRAHVRHCFTAYDELLGRGHDRLDARAMVRDAVEARLRDWSQR